MAHNSMDDRIAGNEACTCNTCTTVKERAAVKMRALSKAQYQFTSTELVDLRVAVQTSTLNKHTQTGLIQTINQIIADRSK